MKIQQFWHKMLKIRCHKVIVPQKVLSKFHNECGKWKVQDSICLHWDRL